MYIIKKSVVVIALIPVLCCCSGVQNRETASNDFNTPLHLLAPAYNIPYGLPSDESIKEILDRIWTYLDRETPALVINKTTNEVIEDYSKIDENSILQRGAFRMASYEWGVTYAGMTLAGEITGDTKFSDYTTRRLRFLSEAAPYFKKLSREKNIEEPQLRQLINPHALDDAGSMCVAFIKASYMEGAPDYGDIIDNYINWIMYGEKRLADGTLSRNRPVMNTLWLDDMFMSIPALAWMGRYTGDVKYYDEAVKQIRQFASRMFVSEMNLFMHGWVESMSDHPAFFWGRANGWAIMTLVEVLEVLPDNHPGYNDVMNLYRLHVKGITALQSGEGLWHQLLNRNDSYLETSASAIYTYCIARGINRKWLDFQAYGPCVILSWNAISQKVNELGQVTGTCVGTGMAFDPAFYYYRPVNNFAAHGYGPVLLAASEMTALLKNTYPKMNDNAVQFYTEKINTDLPTFEVKN
jgi:rhamnogalacturonyl hydrolase YesR